MNELIIKTIENASQAEIIEKKSKFIASIYRIDSKIEAEEIINKIKAKYKDAKHNCFAFSVYEENQKYTKCSDDGEPAGTAGVPILNVIEKAGLTNILIVVTRYFGGILLGTGGLTRAYSEVSSIAIKNSNIILLTNGWKMRIELDYNNSEKFKIYCEKNNITIEKVEYKENVTYIIEITDEQLTEMIEKIEVNNEKNAFNIKEREAICRKYVKKTI